MAGLGTIINQNFYFECVCFIFVCLLQLPSLIVVYPLHYENMSMQYTAIFHGSKNEKKNR